MVRNVGSSRRTVAASFLAIVALVGLGLLAGTAGAQVQTLTCPAPGFGEVVIPPAPGFLPFVPLTSLKTVPNPVIPKDPVTGLPIVRDDLVPYIANLPAAIQLGKALFWDMQAGSDNKTACATCHFHAGADNRTKNQLNPGANAAWDASYGPNITLQPFDFPFTDFAVTPARNVDNIAGSQGIRKSTFQGIGRGGVELTASVADPVFSVNGVNVRQVTGLNTPLTINSVFNHRNFFNGRAQPEFNGVNPWGSRDGLARVWTTSPNGTLASIDIRIPNASLASQAVGPPLNPVEMSAAGRTFPDLGKKMLLLKPLGLQKVDPSDSVLGPLADTTKGLGLKTSYASLIKLAFQPAWWSSNKTITLNGKSYSLMEANFSLFWGLSIMLYEATLVSDNSPMDQYVATRVFDAFNFDPITGLPLLVSHDPSLLDQVVTRLAAEGITITRQQILDGLALFELPLPLPGAVGLPAGTGVGCNLCHVSAETTSASVRNLTGPGLEPADVVFKNAGFDLRMERMFMGFRVPAPLPPAVYPPVPVGTDVITFDPATYAVMVTGINGLPVTPLPAPTAVYDAGWYNIGVRPTAEDLGVGGVGGPGLLPLSWTQFFQTTLSSPSIIKVPGGGLGCPTSPPAAPATSPFAGEVLNPLTGFPLLTGGLLKTEATDVAGSFKTSSLRNVELTGPYVHNGGKSTLRQLVELYDDGGNFKNPTLSPLIRPLGMTLDQVNSLVAFLLALTDERVRFQQAPFDHPQLFVPNGDNPAGTDTIVEIKAVGAVGSATPLQRFLNLNPFSP